MKNLEELKLNRLSNAELNARELNRLLGGGTPGDCCCGCLYADTGGSSTSANDSSNNANGLHSPGCSSGVSGNDDNIYSYQQCEGSTWVDGGMTCPGPCNCGFGLANTCLTVKK